MACWEKKEKKGMPKEAKEKNASPPLSLPTSLLPSFLPSIISSSSAGGKKKRGRGGVRRAERPPLAPDHSAGSLF